MEITETGLIGSDEVLKYLKNSGVQEDGDIDIFKVSVALSSMFNPGVSADRCLNHFAKLLSYLEKYCEDNKVKSLEDKINAINHTIYDEFEYSGDSGNYDDIQNLSLAKVIERRKGIPISLGIIYISLAKAVNININGLNFPGHFLMRAEEGTEIFIIDPFRDGEILNAAGLRAILKSVLGKTAELSQDYYQTVSNREILIRLQNNLKSRLISSEDYQQAIDVSELMLLVDPKEYRLYLDLGVLKAKLGQKESAIEDLENYIKMTPALSERSEAELLITQILET